MPLRPSQLEEPNINLTSMLDVLLTIIIFFVMVTQFEDAKEAEERQYEVKLPTVSDATALTGQPDAIVVNVLVDGSFMLRQKQINIVELEATMRGAAQNYAGQAVVIRADGKGHVQSLMDAMSACRRAGIKNISLAHRPKPSSA